MLAAMAVFDASRGRWSARAAVQPEA
jgi:hypothetical protein